MMKTYTRKSIKSTITFIAVKAVRVGNSGVAYVGNVR